MKTRLALKLLSKSDIGIFKDNFDPNSGGSAGNQKSINLNANPLRTIFYPNLNDKYNGIYGVDLRILGPNFTEPENILQRKVIKSAKNWRLNGEFIHSPDNSNHYGDIEPEDIALMEFIGQNQPERIKLVLVSKNLAPDLHSALLDRFELKKRVKSMISVSEADLVDFKGGIDLDKYGSAIDYVLSEYNISDAFLTGQIDNTPTEISFTNQVRSNQDLQAGKVEANLVGENGEIFIDEFLLSEYGENNYQWASQENAISPYDFIVISTNTYLDVKSTKGKFEQPFFMSLNEVKAAAVLPEYRIYRVFNLSDNECTLKISEPIKEKCIEILKSLDQVTPGVKPTALTISTELFNWSREFELNTVEE